MNRSDELYGKVKRGEYLTEEDIEDMELFPWWAEFETS